MKTTSIIITTLLCLTSCLNHNEISFQGSRFFHLENALIESKKDGKPLLIYFNSFGCQNCRRIEAKIQANSKVKKLISENYNFVTLYTDDRNKVETKTNRRGIDGKIIKNNISLFVDYQIRLTRTGSQPVFAIITDTLLTDKTIGYSSDINELIKFLE